MDNQTGTTADDTNIQGATGGETTDQQTNEQQPTSNKAEEKKTDLSLEDALKELEKTRREAANYRTQRNELRDAANKWKEHEDSQKSELQLAQEQLAEVQQQLAQAQSENILLEVATTHGIKPEDMALLGAGTKEEIEARAVRIKELYGTQANTNTPPPSQQPRQAVNSGSGVNTPTEDAAYPEAWMPAALKNNNQKGQQE